MIIVLRKSSIALIGLVFVLLMAIYSLNINSPEKQVINIQEEAEDVSGKIIKGKEDKGTIDKGKTDTVNDAKKRIIVVDAGHGGEDPGAVSEYSGLREKEVNLKIAFKTKELLEKEGYQVIMTRTEDVLKYEDGTTDIYQKRKQDLTSRKKVMDGEEVDVVVSIHLNKFSQTQYFGAQVFYPPESPESRELATILQTTLREKVDQTNKRVAMEKKPPAGQLPIMIFKDLKTPTIVVECGFLSNQEEEKKLGDEEYQGKIANAIKEGLLIYFEDTVKE